MCEYVDKDWRPHEIAVNQSEIYVDYEVWINWKKDLLENKINILKQEVLIPCRKKLRLSKISNIKDKGDDRIWKN